MRRTVLLAIAISVLALVAGGLALGVLYSRGTGRVNVLTREIRTAGLPATPVELDIFCNPGPNAAAFGQQLAATVSRITTRTDDDEEVLFLNSDGYDFDEPIPAAVFENSRHYHAENKATLDQLRTLLETNSRARFPTDLSLGAAAELAYLAPLRAGTRLLALDALLATLDGDVFRAERSLNQAFVLADTLRDEPMMISQLVRMALHGIATYGIQVCVNRGSFSAGQLERLQSLPARFTLDGATAFAYISIPHKGERPLLRTGLRWGTRNRSARDPDSKEAVGRSPVLRRHHRPPGTG